MSLCETFFILYLVLVQPRKGTDKPEKLSTGMLSINSNNQGPQLRRNSVLDLGLEDCSMQAQFSVLKQCT